VLGHVSCCARHAAHRALALLHALIWPPFIYRCVWGCLLWLLWLLLRHSTHVLLRLALGLLHGHARGIARAGMQQGGPWPAASETCATHLALHGALHRLLFAVLGGLPANGLLRRSPSGNIAVAAFAACVCARHWSDKLLLQAAATGPMSMSWANSHVTTLLWLQSEA
jgi:hypothetical protein